MVFLKVHRAAIAKDLAHPQEKLQHGKSLLTFQDKAVYQISFDILTTESWQCQIDKTLRLPEIMRIREAIKNPSNGKIPLKGGGVPPFSVNFFPLTFLPAVVR